MHRHWNRVLALAVAVAPLAGVASAQRSASDPHYVSVVTHEADRRVDVLVGGKPFTSYLWPTSQRKPVLYPIRTASGIVVTRGFPLEPRAGERIDHPHHAGLWFNYGDVNGLDFWNNSEAIPAATADKYGTIVHRSVRGSKSGAGEGTLDVTEEWVDHLGNALLREETRFVFRAKAGVRTIDRVTTLTALGTPVSFKDNKEGLIGLRVARWLEQPSLTPEKFADASGKVTDVAKMDTAGVRGLYLSSEGTSGDAVWGTRAKWAMLTGDMDGQAVTLAMLDHPKNVGYPTYWHARGYGLFAANGLGQKAMSKGKDELNFNLAANTTVTFRHQILILDGRIKPAELDNYYAGFSR
ncbi:MAG: PmoA family protein [Gemmatimonadaceae bacterium]|nr:PmoA family protein [Gemmatimonadaceae bacterium]